MPCNPLRNPPPRKKMIILQKETEEHRDAWTSAPQGEPGTPPSVLTPHSPSTIKRAAGVGTLYWDTIYASAAETYVTTPFCTGRGGSSLPPGWGRVLGQGRPRPPPNHARAAKRIGGRGVGRGPPSTPPPFGGHFALASSGSCVAGGLWRSGVELERVRLPPRTLAPGGTVLLA